MKNYILYFLTILLSNNGFSQIKAGFCSEDITPKILEPWIDTNKNNIYDPKIDTYKDLNKNGRFDGIWIAGYANGRAATKVAHPLKVNGIIIKNKTHKIGLLSIDSIGIGYDDVLFIRKLVQKNSKSKLDHLMIASTHSHQTPDSMGLWGPKAGVSGVDENYMKTIYSKATECIIKANSNLVPANIFYGKINVENEDILVDDFRQPIVKDPGIYTVLFKNTKSSKTLGTIVSWASHPETMGGNNQAISPDFPHFFRTGISEGIYINKKIQIKGLGGVTLYFTGAIGGLLSINNELSLIDPNSAKTYKKASIGKAEVQGNQLANEVISKIATLDSLKSSLLNTKVAKVKIPVTNKNFIWGIDNKLIRRTWHDPKKKILESEVNLIQLGEIQILTIPGEIYPEIVNGGIVNPPGADFKILKPIEKTPIRTLMSGKMNMVIGLGNDELGYIIPKSEWDEKPPYLYNDKLKTYGEENSTGPETSGLIYQGILSLINKK